MTTRCLVILGSLLARLRNMRNLLAQSAADFLAFKNQINADMPMGKSHIQGSGT